LAWAVLSVRAVALATLFFLMIVIFSGLNYGLSSWIIAVVVIGGITLLQTSYVVIVILCSDLKETDLSAPTPINSQVWAPVRRGRD
jgi:hypothetical protein